MNICVLLHVRSLFLWHLVSNTFTSCHARISRNTHTSIYYYEWSISQNRSYLHYIYRYLLHFQVKWTMAKCSHCMMRSEHVMGHTDRQPPPLLFCCGKLDIAVQYYLCYSALTWGFWSTVWIQAKQANMNWTRGEIVQWINSIRAIRHRAWCVY